MLSASLLCLLYLCGPGKFSDLKGILYVEAYYSCIAISNARGFRHVLIFPSLAFSSPHFSHQPSSVGSTSYGACAHKNR